MRTLIKVLVLAMAIAFEATAQARRTTDITPAPSGRYSLLGGETVPTGMNVVTGDVTVAFGIDLPMTLYVTPSPVRFVISPMFGPAVEFHVDPRLAVGLNTRFGPVIYSTGGSDFGFVTQLMLAYRM